MFLGPLGLVHQPILGYWFSTPCMTLCPQARLAFLLFALLASPGQAYLEDGSVSANTDTSTGSTSSASERLTLSEVFPGGLGNGFASASIFGEMDSVTVSTSCTATSNNFQSAANALSEVRITDELTLNVPGLPVGEIVIAKIAYSITGNAARTQSGEVIIQALAVAEGPENSWRRETGNQGGPFDFDPTGIIVFDFPIKVNLPEANNVDLSIRAASACGRDPLGDPLGSFSGDANANIRVEFVGMVDVTTQGGQKLYDWTVVALSELDYGEGEPQPPPPVAPQLSIQPSQITPGDLTLSWHADPSQALILQSSTNGLGWYQEVPINVAIDSLEIDPSSSEPTLLYRITSTNPTGPLSDPELMIEAHPEIILLSWPAVASETYRIFSSPDLQNWTEIQEISGASGLIEIALPGAPSTLYYRIEASFS